MANGTLRVAEGQTLTIARRDDLPNFLDELIMEDNSTIRVGRDVAQLWTIDIRRLECGQNGTIDLTGGSGASAPPQTLEFPQAPHGNTGRQGYPGNPGGDGQDGVSLEGTWAIASLGSLRIVTRGGDGGAGGRGGKGQKGGDSTCTRDAGGGGQGGSGGPGGNAGNGGDITIRWRPYDELIQQIKHDTKIDLSWFPEIRDDLRDVFGFASSLPGLTTELGPGGPGAGAEGGPQGDEGSRSCSGCPWCKGVQPSRGPGPRGQGGLTAHPGRLTIERVPV